MAEIRIPTSELPEDFGYEDDKKLIERHNREWYKSVDECAKALNDASLELDFGSRDRTMKAWADKWERETGATEEDLIAQNEGRR